MAEQAPQVNGHASEQVNGHANGQGSKLRIVITGAGIAGLAASIALTQNGHHVELLEARDIIDAAVGAGIQMAPNSMQLLSRLGCLPYLEKYMNKPAEFLIRRWTDGEVMGGITMSDLEKRFGYPYVQLDRGDLHRALFERAKECGVHFSTGKKGVAFDPETGTVHLAGGDKREADLILASDGVHSAARQVFSGGKPLPEKALYDAYRNNLSIEAVAADPKTKWLVDVNNQNHWMGADRHALVYKMSGNNQLNMVWVAPHEESRDGQIYLDRVKDYFAGWDPVLHSLLSKVEPNTTTKWPVWMADHLKRLVSDSARLVVIGDAAHDMTPFLGQGSAMAMEDAALIAHLTKDVTSKSELPKALENYERIRGPRFETVCMQALKNSRLWGLPDGEKQVQRDEAARTQYFKSPESRSSYTLSDPEWQQWLWGYDVTADSDGEWARQGKKIVQWDEVQA